MTLWLGRRLKLPTLVHVRARRCIRLLSAMLRTFSDKNREILTRSPTCILGFWELYKLEPGLWSIGLDVREGEQLGGGVCCEY